LQFRGTWSAGRGDDQARFLADLRALRDSAAIGYDELSARAHYPSDVLKEAENGPSLPGLPILSAYVRACEGDVLDWEERWRRLNPEVPDDPDLPVRPAGASAAAVAGARAGVGVAPPDVYDPDRIRAALRGEQGRSEQVGRNADDPGVLAPAADAQPGYDQPADPDTSLDRGVSWGASTGWDTPAEPHIALANGNHAAQHGTRGPFDAAFTSTSDSGLDDQADEFSWLKTNTPQPSPADNEPASWSARADSGLASLPEPEPLAPEPLAPEPDITERIPRYRSESLAAPERTDFWAKPVPPSPAPPAPADLRLPSAPRAEEPVIARASWPSPAETAPPPAAEPAHRIPAASSTAATSGISGVSGSAQPLSPASSPGQPAHAGRPDRYFPARLLVVIVIAALIGSALVLLLK